MVDTTWTSSDLAAIESAIKTGIKRVAFSDASGGMRTEEFQTTADMLAARTAIATALDASTRPPATSRPRHLLANFASD